MLVTAISLLGTLAVGNGMCTRLVCPTGPYQQSGTALASGTRNEPGRLTCNTPTNLPNVSCAGAFPCRRKPPRLLPHEERTVLEYHATKHTTVLPASQWRHQDTRKQRAFQQAKYSTEGLPSLSNTMRTLSMVCTSFSIAGASAASSASARQPQCLRRRGVGTARALNACA